MDARWVKTGLEVARWVEREMGRWKGRHHTLSGLVEVDSPGGRQEPSSAMHEGIGDPCCERRSGRTADGMANPAWACSKRQGHAVATHGLRRRFSSKR